MIYAFDIETCEWDYFLLGAAYSENGDVWRFDSLEEVITWYRGTARGDTILAHNGGRYDFLALLHALPREGWAITRAGSSIVTARYERWGTLYDTYRMVPIKLGDWAAKSEWDHSKSHRNMTPVELNALFDYCLQDCRALLERWIEWEGRWHDLKLALATKRGQRRRTIGSVAFHTAFREAEGEDARPVAVSPREYKNARQGYYGGHTEVFRVNASTGHRFDINSAYPDALTKPVPVGSPTTIYGREAREALVRHKPGIYYARVFVPERRIPLLPHRHRNFLVWANGELEGAWTELELSWAYEHGATIREVRWALIYPRMEAYYAPFIERIYEEREHAIKSGDKAWSKWLKLLMNSLSGKLAERRERERIALFSSRPGVGWEPIDEAERHWRKAYERNPTNARPAQAAYVTSRTRITLGERLIRAGGGAIYCDTDSGYTITYDPIGVNPHRLGQWKYEGGMAHWRSLGPKLHEYEDENGEWVVKAKGVPEASRGDYETLASGGTVTKTAGVETLLQRLESDDDAGFFKAREHKKKIRRSRRVAGTRYIESDGSTTALYCEKKGVYIWTTTTDKPAEILPFLRPARSKKFRLRKKF